MSRAKRILTFVAGRAKPVGFEGIFRAAEPDGGKDRRTGVSAQLCQLVLAKKLKRTGKPGAFLYAATPLTLVDRRLKAATTKSGARKRRLADKAEASAPRAPHTKLLMQRVPVEAIAPAKLTMRDQIAADVDAFLAHGGRIQQLRPGESATPLRAAQEQYLASRKRGRDKQRAERAPELEPDVDELDDVALA